MDAVTPNSFEEAFVMYFDENKKALFVTGMDQELQPLLQQLTNMHPENVLTLQIYGPEIAEPYGDFMRDIILTVYQENVEGIFVVGTTDDERIAINMHDLQRKIYEQGEMKEKIKTIDFLFTQCRPEFRGVTFNKWLEGSKTVVEAIQKSVKLLRDHPLIPSNIRVCGLLVDKKNGELSELQVG